MPGLAVCMLSASFLPAVGGTERQRWLLGDGCGDEKGEGTGLHQAAARGPWFRLDTCRFPATE